MGEAARRQIRVPTRARWEHRCPVCQTVRIGGRPGPCPHHPHAPRGELVRRHPRGAAGDPRRHPHVHVIPRYTGDVPDPRGGHRRSLRPGVRRGSPRFHPKAYILFAGEGEGAAFVGSSNLSRTALLQGIEWNYRVIPARDRAGSPSPSLPRRPTRSRCVRCRPPAARDRSRRAGKPLTTPPSTP